MNFVDLIKVTSIRRLKSIAFKKPSLLSGRDISGAIAVAIASIFLPVLSVNEND